MSESFLNGTSEQLGYRPTVPFTLVHAGKYVTEDKSRTDTTTFNSVMLIKIIIIPYSFIITLLYFPHTLKQKLYETTFTDIL